MDQESLLIIINSHAMIDHEIFSPAHQGDVTVSLRVLLPASLVYFDVGSW
jgi:hypothetical protein